MVLAGTLSLFAPSLLPALTITEIMYHPSAAQEASVGGRSLEWIELYNGDPTVLDLSGYSIVNGVSFTFPPDTYLEGRSYLVVCADESAVRDYYGITNTIGNFTQILDNGGERIEIAIYGGATEVSVRYSDRNQWPHAADGTGHTLALSDPYLDPDDNDNWTKSQVLGGTPGGPNFDEPTVVETEILASDEVWRYLEGRSPYPAGWREAGFDDSAWKSGATGIGYGDGDDRTVLADMQNSYWSFAARKEITLTQAQIDSFDDITLEVTYDDGFAFWINGTEVARGSLGAPGSPLQNDTRASSHEASGPESFSIPKALLTPGVNALAAEVHNTSLGSSDSSFIPRLASVHVITPSPSGTPVPVVINECFFRTAGERWLELYNTSSSVVDLSGFWLSDDNDDLGRFELPPGSTLPAHGFLVITEAASGLLYEGVALSFYLSRPDLSEVVAAELFEDPLPRDPLRDETSDARVVDGKGRFQVTATPTRGAPNEVALEEDIVIDEIMYRPPDDGVPPDRPDLEFLELTNRSAAPIDIGGWRFTRGIDYEFPAGTVVAPGAYLVVARTPADIESAHSITGVLGPYAGSLDDGGELIRLVDRLGNIADEVRYYDGGRWSMWADGGGSSLELLDPRQDNSVASAWEASDESSKSVWETIEYTISGYTQQTESEFHIRMLSAAECLIDSVRLRRSTTDYLPNGGFESGTTGWIIQGTHIQSHATSEDSFEGNACLKVVATGDGDTRVNRIERETSPRMSSGNYQVSLVARWLRGGNLLYLSGYRQLPQMQHTHWLQIPENLGSPGRRNSVAVANLGPVISGVVHRPAVPAGGQETTVVARASDADGLSRVSIRHRPRSAAGGAFALSTMFDDGAHGDAEAGDGLFGGTIPGEARGTRVVYYIEAEDSLGNTRTFPRNAPERTLVYLHDTPLTANGFTYRVIHDDATWSQLNSRQLHSNELLDATFVFEESKVYYNVGTRYRGSPWNRPGNPRMYRVRFEEDHPWRGRGAINLSRYGNAQRERAAYYSVWRNSTPTTPSPMSRSAFARVRTNAGTYTMEHIEPVNHDYLKLWFGHDSGGLLLKVTGKQVFDDNGNHRSNLITWADYRDRGGDKALYRWNFNQRTHELRDDFRPLMALMDAIDSPTAELDAKIETIMDVEQFLRVYAARCAHDDWDTISIRNGQNAYFYYAPIEGRWKLLPWDMDHSWDNVSARIYPDADPRFRNLVNRPKFRRIYQGVLKEMVIGRRGRPGFWSGGEMVTKVLDRNSAVVGRDGVQGAGGIRNFINSRRGSLARQVPARVDFAVTSNAGEDFSVNKADVVIQGRAWVDVSSIAVNGTFLDPLWLSASTWRATVPVQAGPNVLDFFAFDADGRPVGDDTITVTSTVGWATPTITAITPAAAMPGETVTLGGTEFHDGIAVLFDGLVAANVTFDEAADPAHLRVEVPLHAPGAVAVVVRNIDTRESQPADFTVTALPPHFVRGDVNLDGHVDLSDPIRLLGYLYAGMPAGCLDAGDADNDETLGITDAIDLLEFLFREGATPAAPFPEPGVDEGDPPLDCLEGLDLFAGS